MGATVVPDDILNVGLIGAGRIGRLRAEDLARQIPAAKLLIVADGLLEAARGCADQFGVPRAVADYRAVLDSPDVRAVVISSSTDTHARIIEEAAAAGKHVFCEKPIALSLAEIDRALAAVKRGGREAPDRLQPAFRRQLPTGPAGRGAGRGRPSLAPPHHQP